MTKPADPNNFAHSLPSLHRQWVQSIQQTFQGGIDMGTPQAQNPQTSGVNARVYTSFKQGNSTGVLIRIAASGVNDTGARYNWAGSNTGVVINHGLQRQPIGFKVVDMDKAVQVYRTAPPDDTQITLAPTDNSASVTIYVF